MTNGGSNKNESLDDIRLVRLIVQPLRVEKLYLIRCG